MVGMASTCAGINRLEFVAWVPVRMSVRFVERGWREMVRCRDDSKAMGIRQPHRRDDRPEHEHDQNQPSHAQRCPGGAQAG